MAKLATAGAPASEILQSLAQDWCLEQLAMPKAESRSIQGDVMINSVSLWFDRQTIPNRYYATASYTWRNIGYADDEYDWDCRGDSVGNADGFALRIDNPDGEGGYANFTSSATIWGNPNLDHYIDDYGFKALDANGGDPLEADVYGRAWYWQDFNRAVRDELGHCLGNPLPVDLEYVDHNSYGGNIVNGFDLPSGDCRRASARARMTHTRDDANINGFGLSAPFGFQVSIANQSNSIGAEQQSSEIVICPNGNGGGGGGGGDGGGDGGGGGSDPPPVRGDFDGDRRVDIIARHAQSKDLHLYKGNGAGGFQSGTGSAFSNDWKAFDTIFSPGDFSGDGRPDVIARNAQTKNLHLYKGNGAGGFQGGTGGVFSNDWKAFDTIFSPGDFSGDGKPDIIARNAQTKNLHLYKGNGAGDFQAGTGGVFSNDWKAFDTIFSPGDFSGDGKPDIIARNAQTKNLHLYKGNGAGDFQAGTGGVFSNDWKAFDTIFSPGDFSGDGKPDIIARNAQTKNLHLYKGNGAGDFQAGTGGVFSNDWKAFDIIGEGGRSSRDDFDADGKNDIIARTASTKNMHLFAGDGSGGFLPDTGTVFGNNWYGYDTIFSPGDWNGDTKPDIIARNASTKNMHLFAGNGSGGFLPDTGTVFGNNWYGYDTIFSPGDWNGDTKPDIIARNASTKNMHLFAGNGSGGFLPDTGTVFGNNWYGYDTIFSPGDWNGDTKPDIIARNASTKNMHLFAGNGSGGFLPDTGTVFGNNWYGYDTIFSPGDWNGDTKPDIIARNASTKNMHLFAGNGSGGFLPDTGTVFGSNWYGYDLIGGGGRLSAIDWSGDTKADLIARNATTTNLHLFAGNGSGGFLPGTGTEFGFNWGAYDTIVAVGDWNGDTKADLIARNATTTNLHLFAGNGSGGFLPGTGTEFGFNWGAYDTIVAVGDWNGDTKADLIARNATTTNLHLFAGNGSGGFLPGTGTEFGFNWGAYDTIVAVGDWNGDTKADLIARNATTTNLHLFAGNGSGGFLPGTGTEFGFNWGAYDTIVAVGDWNGDTKADLIARNATTTNLHLFAGNGSGGFLPGTGTEFGFNWGAYEKIAS
ncbi:FG-GAP-like repeat-containing protein [Micromonospora sp. WMMA2032]|uniref:FG-GAP-like repeat-containing protein n=1 Tax=Micromonospora sp. WMMA2032 TaxID=2039870 RepID=UPI0015621115|nr:FG-GAP-like repeat-containing protein [Micromonospora sp. WMMA2032]